MRILDDYVYKTLERYDNCMITLNDFKKYGKNKILNDLKNNGYNCTLEVRKIIEKRKYKIDIDTIVILEKIK